MERRYRRMEDLKPWPGVGTELGTRSKRGLKPIAKNAKMFESGDVVEYRSVL